MLQIICLHLSGSSKRWITNSQPLCCTCCTWFHLLPHSEFSGSVQFSDRVHITILHSKQGWWFYDFEVWWCTVNVANFRGQKNRLPKFDCTLRSLRLTRSHRLSHNLSTDPEFADSFISFVFCQWLSCYPQVGKIYKDVFFNAWWENRIVMNHRWNTRCLPTTCECRACWIALPTCPLPQMLQIRITCQPCKNVFTYDFVWLSHDFVWLSYDFVWLSYDFVWLLYDLIANYWKSFWWHVLGQGWMV